MSKVNDDLRRERVKCSFNIQELTNVIDGGEKKTLERKDRESVLVSAKVLFEGVPEEYLSQKEKYEKAIRQSVVLFDVMKRMRKEKKISINNYREVFGQLLGSSVTRDNSPLAVHFVMFMPGILNLATEEQQAKWLPRAWNCNIIGTYAQTELGHGTFIRGLETTATYDATTKEFVLHSPTLTSYKWWPGGLGHTANYCIVLAQLYTKGRCHGVHPFMVQVRDEDTHMPLPGIKVGDIGAKLGLNVVNNGFLGFDNVRIPRANMLMKHAHVTEDGTFMKSNNSKLNYGAMVFVRVIIVFDMVCFLSKAVTIAITIAIRYSAVRRQSKLKDSEPECQILDYLTQQHKLFIGIATCHALRTSANKLWDVFTCINDQLIDGNLEQLPELHALACCLKAVSTSDTACLVERCRQACGGHGYMHSSNLPFTYGMVTAATTYEGENTVLFLQTARFLLKTWQQSSTINLTPTVAYLKDISGGECRKWQNSVEGIIRGFQMSAMKKISSCSEIMNNRVNSDMALGDAWNMSSIHLVSAAEAHCRAYIISTFHEETQKLSDISSALRTVLRQFVELYAVYWALERLSDLLLYTSISKNDVEKLQSWYEQLLIDLRPNAVGLVDAFDLRDEMLHSTLGSYDGRVYERLMEEALRCPLNAEPVNQSYYKYLRPFMKGKL